LPFARSRHQCRRRSSAEQQALAFGDVELGIVIGNAILEPRVVDADLLSIARDIEVKQVAALECRTSGADEQVAVVLRTKRAAVEKSDFRRVRPRNAS
jgi:hypothetical protein